MKQMTIRNFDRDLETGIEELARRKKWSRNQVAIHLMRKGLGLSDESEPERIGNRLESYFGVWNDAERKAFDAAIDQEFGQVDPDQWK